MASDFDSVAYNLRHTDLMKRCTQEYEERGYTVTLESQNESRIQLAGATISSRADVLATRDDVLVIVEAKTAQPSQAHEIQVMLYMMFLELQGARARDKTVTGEVYYSPDHTVAIPAGAADQEFQDLVVNLITRLTTKEAPRKTPSASECRFCPIPKKYYPERIDN